MCQHLVLLEDTNTDDLIVRSHKRKKMIIDNLSYEMLSPDFTGNLAAIMTVPPNTASSENVLEHKERRISICLRWENHIIFKRGRIRIRNRRQCKDTAYLKA